jgi:hypothetical protein
VFKFSPQFWVLEQGSGLELDIKNHLLKLIFIQGPQVFVSHDPKFQWDKRREINFLWKRKRGQDKALRLTE